jgi:hypothetical protein
MSRSSAAWIAGKHGRQSAGGQPGREEVPAAAVIDIHRFGSHRRNGCRIQEPSAGRGLAYRRGEWLSLVGFLHIPRRS